MLKHNHDCPSARCAEGARLFGIVQADGSVGYLGSAEEVSGAFVDAASAAGPPEQRFRFTNRCAESECRQWTGSRCGVIDRLLELHPESVPGRIPNCTLRRTCRWFHQRGIEACSICPIVVTEIV
jgi:hypothetical protein